MNYLYEALEKPTRLYIKQCPHCGLKYFGKYTGQNIETYSGSGTRWIKHLKKHKVEPVHLWNSDLYYDTSISRFALKFSYINKIVKSKDWANLIAEDGIKGYSSIISKKIQKERILNGTHHLLGTVSTINEFGETRIMKIDEYKSQNEFVTVASNKGYEYRGLDPKKHKKTNKGKKYDVRKDSKIYLKGDNRTEEQKIAALNHSEKIKTMDVRPTKKGEKLSEEHKESLRGPRPHTKVPKPKVTCPCCGKIGGAGSMGRWHFDNCKDFNK